MRRIRLVVEEIGKGDRAEEMFLEDTDQLPTVAEVLSSLQLRGVLRTEGGVGLRHLSIRGFWVTVVAALPCERKCIWVSTKLCIFWEWGSASFLD